MSRVASDADALGLLAANRRGIGWMCVAMGLFIVNDTIVKYVSQSMPTTQLIFVRGLMASVLIFAVARALGATRRIHEITRGTVAVRALVEAFASLLYLWALFNMPIANATAINLASPLIITVLAVIFLREPVGWRRWSAIAAGFAGVLLVIQPAGEGFNVFALVCLLGTFFHAVRDLLTRRIEPGIPSILISLSTAIAVGVLAGVLSIFEGWQSFGLRELALLACAAVFLAGGYYAIIQCMREGEMSLIAPFRYTGLLWAVVLGFAVWGDVPNALAWSGITLLIGSGIYVLHRERVRVREARRVAAAASAAHD